MCSKSVNKRLQKEIVDHNATCRKKTKKNVDNFALSTDEVLALPERKISKLPTLHTARTSTLLLFFL